MGIIEFHVIDFIVAGAIAVGIVVLALIGYVVGVALWASIGDWKRYLRR